MKGTPGVRFAFIVGSLPRSECMLFSGASSLFERVGGATVWKCPEQDTGVGRFFLVFNVASTAIYEPSKVPQGI